jgi:cysteine desulfurase
MSERAYLDWNATAPLRPEALVAMLAALEEAGNPSSVHAEGRAARRLVEQARGQVAAAVGARADDVVFTAGGTEANALALTPGWQLSGRTAERLIVSAVEHPSVLAGGRFPAERMSTAPVNAHGVIDLDALKARLAAGGPALVSLMLANNETGAVQPVPETARIVHEAGGILHVDAVQALGRMPIDARALGADLLTISAHKIGGPKGNGALIVTEPALRWPVPLIRGGGQERNRRAGTENVAGIAGFGAAAEAAAYNLPIETKHMSALRSELEAGLIAIDGTMIFSQQVPRLPNTTLFALKGIRAETAVIAFDLEGVAVSSGAACSSGKVQASHVLAAMAIQPEIAVGAIRVSLGPTTKKADINRCIEAWKKLANVLRKAK